MKQFIFAAVLALSGAAAWAQGGPITSTTSPIFVLDSLDATFSVIDPKSWTETKRIATGKEPHHVHPTPDEKSLVIASSASDSLIFIDPKTAEIQRTARGMVDPCHLRFSPDMRWFVTAANRLNHVDVHRWDGKDFQLAKRIATGRTPSHIWIDGRSTTAYVTMQDGDELVAVDLPTQTLRWRTPTGRMPADVFGTPDGKLLLVTSRWAKKLNVVDLAQKKVVRQINVGRSPHGVWTLDHAAR